jgi:urease accessory protein
MQVINKTDLAEAIGADLKVMEHDALHMRDGGPIVFAQVILSFQFARIL